MGKKSEELGSALFGSGAVRTHREVAARMGISRSRVFYHEQMALRKIRAVLASAGIHGLDDADELEEHTRAVARAKPKQKPLAYSPLHGWLAMTRIVSVNQGSINPEDVSQAFTFLKLAHPKEVHPPVWISPQTDNDVPPYSVEAAAFSEGALHVRLWPTGSASRSVKAFVGAPALAVVDSEFESDSDGEFDIPILMAVFISLRTSRPH